MNNLKLFLLGLVLIYMPACLSQNDDKQCFSQTLKPSYPCCTGNKVVFADKDGDWGVENGKWCGIGNGPSKNLNDFCFSIILGYPCCKSYEVLFTDESGDWGIENGKWCGIKDSSYASAVDIEETLQNDIEETIQDDIEETVQNDTDFDFSFLKMENNKKNMLYSPLSIKYALNMLQKGADNNTYAEINAIIGDKELPKYTNLNENITLANGLFIRDSYYELVKTEYINALKEEYDAEVIKDEFKNAQNANKWVEDNTLGIIKNILSDKVVQDPDVGMLIINALAMNFEWALPFSPSKTHGQKFYKDDGQEMEATMMSLDKIQNSNLAYYMDSNITVLTMNLKKYNETQFEFMAIMPKENLSEYVNNVSLEQISEIDQKLKLTSRETAGVNIRIPKFQFDYSLNLKQDLMKLGIKDAFDKDTANFSNIVDFEKQNSNIFVADALHKANIEFTEKGAKVAAASVIVGGGFGIIAARIEFPLNIVINKPFMFIIRDKNTKDIWFTGTVYEPNLWESNKSSNLF